MLAAGDLCPHALGVQEPKAGGGVRLRMIADAVTATCDFTDEFGVARGAVADEEEQGFCLMQIKQIEQARGGIRIWAVVDGEADAVIWQGADERAKQRAAWNECADNNDQKGQAKNDGNNLPVPGAE